MLIYINGDSHAAAAEAVVPHGWAEDDPFFFGLGKRPHPENERVSFGCEIANQLHAIMDCDAQSGASNQRIMRTTQDWIQRVKPQERDLIIVQWSTWEREEWIIEGEYYQVGASGTDSVPESHQENYRSFIRDMNWHERRRQCHQDIWEFHCELKELELRHVFFNGNNHFEGDPQWDWQNHYIAPYDSNGTYDSILRANGYKTVNSESWHFGADAHCFWANYVLQYIHDHKL
jgi:hypothetical protein